MVAHHDLKIFCKDEQKSHGGAREQVLLNSCKETYALHTSQWKSNGSHIIWAMFATFVVAELAF